MTDKSELNTQVPVKDECVISQAISDAATPAYSPSCRIRTKRDEINSLIEQIAIKHGVTLNQVLGPDRFKQFVTPRHEAMAHVARTYPHLSYPHLGKIFNRDHSTVMHACRKHGVPSRALVHHTREYIDFAMSMAREEKETTNESA